MKGSQTVDRALQLLDVLAACSVPPRLSDLAEASGFNISTTSRLLASLQRYGFVRRDSIDGRYRLGYKLMTMANVVQEQSSINETTGDVLQTLVDETNETASFNMFVKPHVMMAARVTCLNQMRNISPVGSRWPLYCTAAGKAILAYRSSEEIDEILDLGMPQLTPLTITSREQMLDEIATITTEGYAVDRGEREEGLVGIAAPVYSGLGKVVASCGISGSIVRMSPENFPQLARYVVAAANEISKRVDLATHNDRYAPHDSRRYHGQRDAVGRDR